MIPGPRERAIGAGIDALVPIPEERLDLGNEGCLVLEKEGVAGVGVERELRCGDQAGEGVAVGERVEPVRGAVGDEGSWRTGPGGAPGLGGARLAVGGGCSLGACPQIRFAI